MTVDPYSGIKFQMKKNNKNTEEKAHYYLLSIARFYV